MKKRSNPTGLRPNTGEPACLNLFLLSTFISYFQPSIDKPFLRDRNLRGDLHSFLGGTSKTLECPTLLVGGVEDHVHLLARFGRTITQADWVKELKRVSSLWLKKEGGVADFEWQAGYADFSVSQSNLEQVTRYIANQEEHHRKLSFQDEVRALLTKHKMEWDERYIWD